MDEKLIIIFLALYFFGMYFCCCTTTKNLYFYTLYKGRSITFVICIKEYLVYSVWNIDYALFLVEDLLLCKI